MNTIVKDGYLWWIIIILSKPGMLDRSFRPSFTADPFFTGMSYDSTYDLTYES